MYITANLDGKLVNIIDNNLYYDGYEYYPYTKYMYKKYNKQIKLFYFAVKILEKMNPKGKV